MKRNDTAYTAKHIVTIHHAELIALIGDRVIKEHPDAPRSTDYNTFFRHDAAGKLYVVVEWTSEKKE